MQLLYILLLGLAGLSQALAYSYLMIMPTASQSHFYVGQTLAKGLVAAGHEVTVISPFPQKKPLQNYTDVATPNIIPAMAVHQSKILTVIKVPIVFRVPPMHAMGLKLTRILMEEPEVQALLAQKRTFDAVICEVFMNEAHFGFAEHFGAPLIAFSSFGASTWTTSLVGTPSPPSYVPNFLLHFSDHMNFLERTANFLFTAYEFIYQNFIYLPKQEQLYKKFFPHNKLGFEEMRRSTGLVLLNNHISLGFPRPYAPSMIEVGGMHINRKRQPLPQDIEEFIKGAQHGVIYFSLGSNMKSKSLPLEKRQALIETFGKLKQRVLWKFEEPDLPGKPDNVFISDWFPQDDILAHENVVLFITHGGLLSTTESIYHGKPFVGIPIFGDQFINMARAEQSGYGVTVRFDKLTAEGLGNAINKILSDTSYAKQVLEMSARFRDQRETPLERAVYWVEHVTRQKGAKYLRNAGQELNFVQYHNLDVLAALGLALITTVYIIATLLRFVVGNVRRSATKVKQN